jgi:hypothetical protein
MFKRRIPSCPRPPSLLAAAGLLLASCSGQPAKAPASTAAPAASSAPLVFAPSGFTPLEATFQAGACTVGLSASPGSSYEIAAPQAGAAIEALKAAVSACWQRGTGTQGTVYLSAQVDGQGRVSDAVPSPGGALATEVAACVADGVMKLKLPAPAAPPANLLVLVRSECVR